MKCPYHRPSFSASLIIKISSFLLMQIEQTSVAVSMFKIKDIFFYFGAMKKNKKRLKIITFKPLFICWTIILLLH